MIDEPLGRVLEATGYMADGASAAPSVTLAGSGAHVRLPSFAPDAWWRSGADADRRGSGGVSLTVYFKYVDDPEDVPIAGWQREVWNQGFAPLLWIVSPERVDLHNGFGAPRGPDEADANRLETFKLLDAELARLDTFAGRLAMETGRFWSREPRVSRETCVDRRLLRDLRNVERALVAADLQRGEAQALIGRCIFAKYLIDRGIVTERRLKALCGHADLPDALGDPAAAGRLFAWLRETFNGDMFPSAEPVPAAGHLDTVARFLTGEDLETGQRHFFPYRFDVIPVELVSAIYEQFVHSAASESAGANPARGEGVYYTPLAAVSLVLDEVFDGLTGTESVLDLSCGSGVFLVEALRRLVRLKTGAGTPSRGAIRETLYNQVYGVDVSEAAVRIAAFSLYLAALELDPDPQPPAALRFEPVQDRTPPALVAPPRRGGDVALRFEPLQDRTLLVGDARTIEETSAGRAVLTAGGGLKRFDVIVGNPPWSFRGRAGTAARRDAGPQAPLQPRGQSLDFVARARDFAHDGTRFGMILSATPFFGRSATAARAVRDAVAALAPVTLINLSDLSGWLFPKANMPAIALLARHRPGRADRLTLVQARWSPASERSRTIEIGPSDVTTLPIASWKRNTGLFKAAFLGRRPDLLLLDELWEKHEPLEARLDAMGVRFRTGLIFGDRSQDAAFLKGLPFADKKAVGPFSLAIAELPVVDWRRAERPRQRDFYRAPILLVKEFMWGAPRPGAVVAVADRDVAFTDSCYGVSFSGMQPETAYLVAGILGSALASWYFLMTGSAFGLWMRRLKQKDVAAMPVPPLERSLEANAGRRVVELVRAFHRQAPDADGWKALDDAVFDLYELDDADRIVVRDGLFRAGWQWKPGRDRSVEPAGADDLRRYADAFLSTMDAWLSASNRRRMRAEIYDVPPDAPHRVVRFVLENRPGPSVVEVVQPDGPLRAVLDRIGERTEVRVAEALVGLRELRVHARDEVSMVKPAALRHWLGVCGLEDADAVVRDGVRGGPPE